MRLHRTLGSAAKIILLLAIAAVVRGNLVAGDAVAIGYNSAGVWTAVTYYCSGTRIGGKDYKDEGAARQAALLDLRKRAGEDLARGSILASSDKTGFFAYGRGKDTNGHDQHGVASGLTAEEAEKNLFATLKRKGVETGGKAIYRYHSYGSTSN